MRKEKRRKYWDICKLCDKQLLSKDKAYHHWHYGANRRHEGIYLCRACHSYIHNGLTALEQKEMARDVLGIDNWRALAIPRTIILDEKNHPKKYMKDKPFNYVSNRVNYVLKASVRENEFQKYLIAYDNNFPNEIPSWIIQKLNLKFNKFQSPSISSFSITFGYE